jgi:orotate phosphoribosyltransferase
LIQLDEDIQKLATLIKNSLMQVGKEPYFEYDEWKVFHDPEALSIVVKAIYKKIQATNWEFDCIAALGGSGTPIAVSLVNLYFNHKVRKNFFFVSDPLIGISSKWVRIIKPNLTEGNRSIVLVDTEVKSGRTIYDGYRKVQDRKLGNVVGIATITDYVGFPDRKDYNDIVVANQIPLIKLFDYNPLKPELTLSR